nr:MAG TPA: hypothetical protein [Caudoviricetes sp.]
MQHWACQSGSRKRNKLIWTLRVLPSRNRRWRLPCEPQRGARNLTGRTRTLDLSKS